MTIKRQLVKSNVRTVLVTLFGLFLSGFVLQLVLAGITGVHFGQVERQMEYHQPFGWERALFLLAFVLFVMIISGINNLLNYRLLKNIVRPLQPLTEGVKQIHDNNLAFRIHYENDDEYRPICDAFNEMAARLEASALRQQKDEANRRELIAGISHDLRTPLTSIKGYLEGLETGVASTGEMRCRYFTTIKNKTGDMEHIIEQLFLFSKLDMDEFPLALRRVSLVPLIADMIAEVTEEYRQRGLAVSFLENRGNTAEYTNVCVSIDTYWLRNVCINIFENSVRYKTTENGAVEISVVTSDEFVVLRFDDDGPGVPADALPNLFDVFYRVDPARSAKGSGLGLAISRKIIERMGGTIHAELPAAGGLAIVIRLPVMQDI